MLVAQFAGTNAEVPCKYGTTQLKPFDGFACNLGTPEM